MQKLKLVAADSNVLILLAQEDDLTCDACETIQARIKPAQLIATPIVIEELTHKVLTDPMLRQPARKALTQMRLLWRCQPTLLNAVQEPVALQIAHRLHDLSLLPSEERHDALLLAQAAVLNCTLLLTYDSHLRDIDFQRLTLSLREF